MNQVKGNGASSTLFQHDRPNNPNRSKFDLSRITNFSIDVGQIVPYDCIPVLPGDDFKISNKMALDTLPLVQSSLTNYKIITHHYYIKNRDLWKGWKTFVTKGRSGNVNLTIPQVDLSAPLNGDTPIETTVSVDSVDKKVKSRVYAVSHHSLSSFLGLPPVYSGSFNLVDSGAVLKEDYLPYSIRIDDSDTVLTSKQRSDYNSANSTGFGKISKVNALPFVAYQNIVKNNYVPQNLLQDNTALFPVEGDDDWLLPYTIENNVANYISGRSALGEGDKVNYNGIYSKDETDVDLRLLRYCCFDDDYFTTGLPWLQRGDVSSLGLALDIQNSDSFLPVTGYDNGNDTDYFKSFLTYYVGSNASSSEIDSSVIMDTKKARFRQSPIGGSGNDSYFEFALPPAGIESFPTDTSIDLGVHFPPNFFNSVSSKLSFTANQLRELIAMSVWQERNARVDGSYNRMIFQHWQRNPHSEEHKPVYIGGTCDYLNFSTVIQNSESTSSSHLGDTAGFGSSSGSGDVGTFHCDDYGYIISVMMIKPNTTYTQGLEHHLFENTFDDFVQPEFEGLSPQPILNKELFISGDSSDNDLFCYQERYTYLKVRHNVNRGLFQVKPEKDRLFGAFTQSRWFESKPSLSYQFCCISPDNVRRDWLAYPVYPTFRVQMLSSVFVTRCLAYSSQPNTFGF